MQNLPFMEITKCCGTCKFFQYGNPPVCFNPKYRGIEGFNPQIHQICYPENVEDGFQWHEGLLSLVKIQEEEELRRKQVALENAEKARIKRENEEKLQLIAKRPFILRDLA